MPLLLPALLLPAIVTIRHDLRMQRPRQPQMVALAGCSALCSVSQR